MENFLVVIIDNIKPKKDLLESGCSPCKLNHYIWSLHHLTLAIFISHSWLWWLAISWIIYYLVHFLIYWIFVKQNNKFRPPYVTSCIAMSPNTLWKRSKRLDKKSIHKDFYFFSWIFELKNRNVTHQLIEYTHVSVCLNFYSGWSMYED